MKDMRTRMKLFCIPKQTRLFIFGKVTLIVFLILRLYKEKVFDFDETKDVFNLIVSLLKKAIKRGVNVKAERI